MTTSRYANLLAGAASIAAALGFNAFKGITTNRITTRVQDNKLRKEIADHNAEIEAKRQAKKARKGQR